MANGDRGIMGRRDGIRGKQEAVRHLKAKGGEGWTAGDNKQHANQDMQSEGEVMKERLNKNKRKT